VANSWRILRIVLMLAGIILLILATVVVLWGDHFFGPPHGSFMNVKIDSNTTLNFTFGQPDKATSYSGCILILWIDDQPNMSRDIQTGIDHPMIMSYFSQPFQEQPDISFVVVVHDLNNNGKIDAGDYVTLASDSSLEQSTRYVLEIMWKRTYGIVCTGYY